MLFFDAMQGWLTAAVLLPMTAALATERPKVIVLDVVPADESTQRMAKLVTEQVLTELSADARFEVASQSELAAVLGLERQRQLLGCSDDSGSCAVELGGALGARWIVMGTIGRFGTKLRFDLKLVDSKTGTATKRDGRVLNNDDELFATVSALVQSLLGAHAETTASKPRLGGWFVGGAGVVAVGLGALFMGLGSSGSAALNERRSMLAISTAQAQLAGLQAEYWGGVVVGITGLAALVVGAVLLALPPPPDVTALSFTPSGLAVSW